MTRRARFGDFLAAAHRHLDPASTEHGPAGAHGGADEAARSLYRTVTVMGRHLHDLGPAFADITAETQPELGPWPQALAHARKALANSARILRPDPLAPPRAPRRAASQFARRLDGVTFSLTAARDLLQTHFTVDPDRARRDGSEWAAVIASPAATRAQLAEFGTLSRQIARQGTALALGPAPDAKTTAEARRRLNAACQWLLTVDNAVRAAHQQQPIPARDRELLWAIPSTALPPRRVPDPGDPVPVLVQGVIDSAERLRRATWTATNDGSWYPGITVTYLRWTAKAAVATSDHNDILLATLADAATATGHSRIREDLRAASDAAARARQRWVSALHALDDITTDMQDYASPAAHEARSLAWWTGRLAYADPMWTPDFGTAYRTRPSDVLAAGPGDVRAVVAAIHHASDALTHLAHADRRQIHEGERGARILVPTRFLPERSSSPRPFGRATHDHVQPLLDLYQDAGQASANAAAAVSPIAEAVRSPSRIITTAQAATNPETETHPEQVIGGPDRTGGQEADRTQGRSAQPGPVERTLLDLGVRYPDMLQRGAELDRASRQIVLDAASDQDRDHHRPASMLNRSEGTAQLFNHVVEGGDAHATVLLRRPVSVKPEAPEAEH